MGIAGDHSKPNMESFVDNEELSDVIIHIEPEAKTTVRTLPGHRVILSSKSEYFRTIFRDRWNGQMRQEVTIRVPDESFMQAGYHLYQAMYGAMETTLLDDRTLVKVARLANQYQVSVFRDTVTSLLIWINDSLASLELTRLLLEIDQCFDDKLTHHIKKITKASSDFAEATAQGLAIFAMMKPLYDDTYKVIHQFHVDLLVAVLESDDLSVSENTVASIVADYCRVNKPSVDDCIRLIKCIRVFDLTPTYLTGVFPFLFDSYEDKKLTELSQHLQAMAIMRLAGNEPKPELRIKRNVDTSIIQNVRNQSSRLSTPTAKVTVHIPWKACVENSKVLADGVYWFDGVQFQIGATTEKIGYDVTYRAYVSMMHASTTPECIRKGVVCARVNKIDTMFPNRTFAWNLNPKVSTKIADARVLAAAGEKIEMTFEISVL